jgi:hypothetical protein
VPSPAPLRQKHDFVAVIRTGGQVPPNKDAAAHFAIGFVLCARDEWIPIGILDGLSCDLAETPNTMPSQRHNDLVANLNFLEA